MRVLPQALHGLGVALEGAGSQDGAAKLNHPRLEVVGFCACRLKPTGADITALL